MLLLTVYGAMVLATSGWLRPRLVLATLSGLFLPARGAHAVNMWYDRDIDPVMSRTANRPIPQGRVKPTAALVQGIGMEIASIGLLVTADSPACGMGGGCASSGGTGLAPVRYVWALDTAAFLVPRLISHR